jgi:hypothetical protein
MTLLSSGPKAKARPEPRAVMALEQFHHQLAVGWVEIRRQIRQADAVSRV